MMKPLICTCTTSFLSSTFLPCSGNNITKYCNTLMKKVLNSPIYIYIYIYNQSAFYVSTPACCGIEYTSLQIVSEYSKTIPEYCETISQCSYKAPEYHETISQYYYKASRYGGALTISLKTISQYYEMILQCSGIALNNCGLMTWSLEAVSQCNETVLQHHGEASTHSETISQYSRGVSRDIVTI